MKYNLRNVLLKDNETLSHVFLNCVDTKTVERVAAENLSMTEEECDNREIDIQLIIDGREADPDKFFKLLVDQYERLVREEAIKIVKEQSSDILNSLNNTISNLQSAVEYAVNDIEFKVNSQSPLVKTQE